MLVKLLPKEFDSCIDCSLVRLFLEVSQKKLHLDTTSYTRLTKDREYILTSFEDGINVVGKVRL